MKKAVLQTRIYEKLFVGIDVHKLTWHVTIRSEDVELFSGSIQSGRCNMEI